MGQDLPVQTLGATDQEADRAGQRQPAVQPGSECGAVQHFAFEIEGNGKGLARQSGEQRLTLPAFDLGRSAFGIGNFRQCKGRPNPAQ